MRMFCLTVCVYLISVAMADANWNVWLTRTGPFHSHETVHAAFSTRGVSSRQTAFGYFVDTDGDGIYGSDGDWFEAEMVKLVTTVHYEFLPYRFYYATASYDPTGPNHDEAWRESVTNGAIPQQHEHDHAVVVQADESREGFQSREVHTPGEQIFPELPLECGIDVNECDAPPYPEARSIPVQELEVEEGVVPVELNTWASSSEQPMVIEGVLVGPQWMWGSRGAFWVQIRTPVSTGPQQGFRSLDDIKAFPWDDQGRCVFRYEFKSPEDAGRYPIQITAVHPRVHPGELPNLQPGQRPTPEQLDALMVTTVLAEGLLIVGEE